MDAPPSYSEVMASDLRRGVDLQRLQQYYATAPSNRSRQLIPPYLFSSRAWAPSAPLPNEDRSDEMRDRRVVSTVIMFVIIFAVIVIIAKLTQNARFATPLTPRG